MLLVEFVAVFMICLQTEIHLASSLLSLDITVKLKAEHKFYMAVGFFLHLLLRQSSELTSIGMSVSPTSDIFMIATLKLLMIVKKLQSFNGILWHDIS
jgi:hypothetical protein